MTLVYTVNLGLILRFTNVSAQKIDSLALKTYRMAITRFLIQDKLRQNRFLKKTFLLAETNIKVVLEMLFLFFSYGNEYFNPKKLT